MGIGLVAILDRNEMNTARNYLSRLGLRSWEIGEVIKKDISVRIQA
jgi:phosphoribosylaminoimidazole (AIR) synthetase